MEFSNLLVKTKEIKKAYAEAARRKGRRSWTAEDYANGFVGDVGDLLKLILEKHNSGEDKLLDKKLRHELADCMWSITAIATELDIDLEKEFLINLEYLKQKLAETE